MRRTSIILLIITGGIIGVAVVRMFFLSSFQIMGWKIFWNNLSNIQFNMLRNVFESATFGKCLLGFIVGGILGALSGKMLKK
jgi:hypothetical protein